MEKKQKNGMAGKEEEVMLDVIPDLGEPTPEEEKADKRARREVKKQEAVRKVKAFLLENKDVLILTGQLALVTIVCVVSIRSELMPNCCKKKKKRKKR